MIDAGGDRAREDRRPPGERGGFPARLRSVLRSIRHLPDRMVHPVRRIRARADLARNGPPRSLLFVCHGNICRSPYAARAFERVLPPRCGRRVCVESAGFHPVAGRESPGEATRAAAAREVDLEGHRSRVLGAGVDPAHELIFVMDVRQRKRVRRVRGYAGGTILLLGDLDPEPIERRSIRDPFGRPRAVFDDVFRRIDRCVEEAVRHLTGAG